MITSPWKLLLIVTLLLILSLAIAAHAEVPLDGVLRFSVAAHDIDMNIRDKHSGLLWLGFRTTDTP